MTELERICARWKSPAGAVKTGEPVSFRLPACAPSLELVIREDGCAAEVPVPMKKEETGFSCGYAYPREGLFYFAFRSGENWLTCSAGGELRLGTEPDWVQQTVCRASYEAPAGWAGRVAYQIFPDRFAIGGERKRLPGRRYHEDLSEQPFYTGADGGDYLCDDFYGGDLAGIRAALPYLKSLGVGMLYLNPVFLSPSNHRYDTSDYLRVDPQLGTEEDLRQLCDACREQDVRVILDGVFSHTGDDSRYFDRYGRYGGEGACCREDSPYRSWYRFREWPSDYECWWDFPTLPNVEEMDPSYLSFITGEGGVIDHWMRLGVSGFRLDVADELPDAFIGKVREAVKRADPDGLLIGEVWEDASNKVSYGQRRRYFLGGELDGVMNYPFRTAILDFVREADASLFRDRIGELLLHYPADMLCCCLSLLGSHDTARAINMLAAPEAAELSRAEQAERTLTRDEYLRGVEMLKLSFVLLFFLPGIPMIYYGDEGGMQGYKDPFCRGFYCREEADRNLLAFVRELSARRAELGKALSCAATEFFLAEDGAVGFFRGTGEDRIGVLVNRGEKRIVWESPDGSRLTADPWSFDVKKM